MTDANAASATDHALTPAEQAYIESGGENAEALIAENAATNEGEAAPAVDPAADTKTETKSDPKAETEPVADDTAADLAASDPQRPPPQRVSYHKFKRTEERARAAERELTDMREKFARGDERMRLLAEALTVTPPKDDTPPDPETDIFAFVRWQSRQMDRLANELRSTRGEIGATRETLEERHAADALQSAYQRDAVAFARATPDFVHAYNHMLGTRAQMLEDQGYGAADVRGILANEERGLVQRALQANKSPAEMIYAIAQRFGYRRPDGQAPDGKSARSGGRQNGKPSASELIETIRAGQGAGKTLSGAGGAASDLSVEALVNMSEADFNTLLRAKPHQVEALMGRRH
jgi:hypothetical protein